MRHLIVAAGICGLVTVGSAEARTPVQTSNPAQITGLLACRAISDSAQRLACFDRETAGIDKAIAAKELVVIDKQRANEARRGLFGFSAPSLGGLFGGSDDEINQIDGVVASSHLNGDGTWTVVLADGSVWQQTDDKILTDPRKGEKVVVRRGAMGSYLMVIGGGVSVKARRVG